MIDVKRFIDAAENVCIAHTLGQDMDGVIDVLADVTGLKERGAGEPLDIPLIRIEPMSDAFTKFHLEGPWPFHPVIHRFSAPDNGDPHDHPWKFRSIILHGGYREEIFDVATGKSRLVDRKPGDSFINAANHVHRIVELLDGECWTLILPHAWEQESGFYQFREDGAYYRPWHRDEFEKVDFNTAVNLITEPPEPFGLNEAQRDGKAWMVVGVDNLNRETHADFIVARDVRSETAAMAMADTMNNLDGSVTWFRAFAHDYRLSRGMWDLV